MTNKPLRHLFTRVSKPWSPFLGPHQHLGSAIQSLHWLRESKDSEWHGDSSASLPRPLLQWVPDQRPCGTGCQWHLSSWMLTVLTDCSPHQESRLPARPPALTASLNTVSSPIARQFLLILLTIFIWSGSVRTVYLSLGIYRLNPQKFTVDGKP